MGKAVLGFLALIGVVIAATAAPLDRGEMPVGRAAIQQSVAANNELIAATATLGDKFQQVTVIDPKRRVMSVYHVELATGRIILRSVRDIHWDLQMTDYNGENPLPREIRAFLEPK